MAIAKVGVCANWQSDSEKLYLTSYFKERNGIATAVGWLVVQFYHRYNFSPNHFVSPDFIDEIEVINFRTAHLPAVLTVKRSNPDVARAGLLTAKELRERERCLCQIHLSTG